MSITNDSSSHCAKFPHANESQGTAGSRCQGYGSHADEGLVILEVILGQVLIGSGILLICQKEP